MNKSIALLSAILFGLPAFAGAYDSDPWLGDGTWYGGRWGERYYIGNIRPLYYRPTQRYYGSGYTVNYRYIPVYRTDGPTSVPVNGASNFRTEAFHLATRDAQSWGAYPPRLTVKDSKSAAPRTAITSIVRKKTTGKIPSKASTETTPAIVPSATDAGTAVPTPAVTPNNP